MGSRIRNGEASHESKRKLTCRKRAQRGFTLIELMVVMAIISVLLAIAVPIYQKSIIRAKESVLRNNLFTLRNMIDEYTIDKQKAPESSSGFGVRRLSEAGSAGSDDRLRPDVADHYGRDAGRRSKQLARYLRRHERLRQNSAGWHAYSDW